MTGHQFKIGERVVYVPEDSGSGCEFQILALLPPNEWGGLRYRIKGIDGSERVVDETQVTQPRDCD